MFISGVLAKREREKEYQLRKELRKKREKGEYNLFIQRGQTIGSGDTKKQGTHAKQVKCMATRSRPGRPA